MLERNKYLISSSTETAGQFFQSNINLPLLQKLLLEGVPKIQTARGKDNIFVIGNTGSGKSTLITYLLGNEMEKVRGKGLGKYIVQPRSTTLASKANKIGHRGHSETLYPEVKISENDLGFCDCPGFHDNRIREYKICASICTQMAVNLSKSIKTVIVTIDCSEIDTLKGDGLKKLSETLSKLFTNTDIISKSTIFVFTKTDRLVERPTVSDIKEQIMGLIEDFTQELERIKHGYGILDSIKSKFIRRDLSEEDRSKINEIEHKLRIFNLIQSNDNNLFISNVLDDGASRDELFRKIAALEALNKNVFNFKEYDSDRKEFDALVSQVALEATRNVDLYNKLPITIKRIQTSVTDLEDRIAIYQRHLNYLRSDAARTGIINIEKHRLETLGRVAKLEEKIRNKRKDLNKVLTEISDYETEIEGLNSEEKQLHWSEEFKQIWSFTWREHKFEYPKGVKFDYADVRKRPDASFSKEVYDEQKGEYSAFYQSDWWADADAEVSISVMLKDIPENIKSRAMKSQFMSNAKIQKRTLTEEIKQLQQDIDRENRISHEYSETQGLRTTVLDREISGYVSDLQRNQQELERKIKFIIPKTEEELAEVKSILEAKSEIYDLMLYITRVINFHNSLVIQEFNSKYGKYQDDIQTLRAQQDTEMACTEVTVTSEPSRLSDIGAKIPTGFICPISKSIMQDPVNATCGDSFDRLDILKLFQLKKRETIPCPSCSEDISSEGLTPNNALKQSIITWHKFKNDIHESSQTNPTYSTASLDSQALPASRSIESLQQLYGKREALQLTIEKYRRRLEKATVDLQSLSHEIIAIEKQQQIIQDLVESRSILKQRQKTSPHITIDEQISAIEAELTKLGYNFEEDSNPTHSATSRPNI